MFNNRNFSNKAFGKFFLSFFKNKLIYEESSGK